MRIRKEQLAALVDAERRIRREQRIDEFLALNPRASRASHPGRVVVADSRGNHTSVDVTDQGIVGWNTPEGRELKIERDREGRPTSLVEPQGTAIDLGYTPSGDLRGIRRNKRRLLKCDYPQPGLVDITYGDNATEHLVYAGTELVEARDANGHSVRFNYDEQRRLTRLIDGAGRATVFEHDEETGPVAITYADGATEEYVDTESGSLEVRRNGETVSTISFDEEDNLREIRYADGHQVTFKAPSDARFEASTSNHLAAIEFDDEGRVVSEPQGDATVRYSYDGDDNLIALHTPHAGTLRFGYDRDDLLTRVTDWDGRAIEIAYASSGQISRIAFPNGVVSEIEHNDDALDRRLKTTSPVDGAIVNEMYAYDARDRVIELTRGGRSRRYKYDRAGQLLHASDGPTGSEQFTYDGTGNRTSFGRAAAEYDNRDRIQSVGRAQFEHDGAGNLTRYAGRRNYQFAYNGQGHLIEASTPDGVSRFEYDAFGRRIRKTTGETSTHYVWAGRQLLHEWTTRGEEVIERRDYLYYPGEYLPLAVRINGASYYYHTDRLGTPLALTDSEGRLVWRADYTALGRAHVTVEKVKQSLRLPGQYYDEETGLHYNLFRYYQPELGRYLTPDPLRYEGGRTNFYVYANNDPINQVDPDGHLVIPLLAIAIIAGAAVVGGLIGGAINAAMAPKGQGWDAFKKGFVVGAVGGAIGAAVPVLGMAAGLGGLALGAVALAGDALAGGVTACMEEGAGVGTFFKGAGIALVTTLATLGLGKIPGVKKALGALGKKVFGKAKSLLLKLMPRKRLADRASRKAAQAAIRNARKEAGANRRAAVAAEKKARLSKLTKANPVDHARANTVRKNPKISAKRRKHIVDGDGTGGGHGPNSRGANKSKFGNGVDIDETIKDTSKTGTVKPNKNRTDGTFQVEKTYPEPVGKNQAGKPVNSVRVVMDDNGNVITAFPIEP